MTNVEIRDLLPSGLQFINDGTSTVAFVSNGGGIVSNDIAGALNLGLGAAPGVNGSAPVTPTFVLPDANVGSSSSESADLDVFNDGSDPFFKFGQVVNSDNDADAEFIVVEFNALVLNEAAAGNDQGDALNNTFQLRINNQVEDTSNRVQSRITEPLIDNLNKTVNPGTADAGDTVTFTITFSNSSDPTRADAFDVQLLDTLPADLALDLASINVVTAGGTSGVTDNSTGNTVDINFDQVPLGGSVTVTFDAVIAVDAQLNELLTNTANITYTSLPGDMGTAVNPTGSSVADVSGGDEGERNGDGAQNDHIDQDSASVRINSPEILKELVGTSIVDANNANDEAVIGEVVQYSITVTLPEGSASSTQIVDSLDPGLQFLAIDSITSSADLSSNLVNLNDATTINPAVAGQTVTFALGDLVNSNVDNSTPETIVITYSVLVENVPSNQGDANPGTLLENSATFEWAVNGTRNSTASSTAPPVEVIEPILDVDKSVNGSSFDAGDTVTYTIVIDHNALSDTDAFDLTFSDVIPSVLTSNFPADFSITHSASGDLSSIFELTAGNELRTIPGSTFDLLQGETLTITYDAVVGASVSPNQVVSNNAVVDYTSIDGDDPNERNGDDGEGGALDDYESSDGASFTVTAPQISKSLVGTSIVDATNSNTEAVIGELVEYEIVLSLPEAILNGASVIDDLDLGLEFVSLDSIVALSGGAPTTDLTSSVGAFSSLGLFAPTISGDGVNTSQQLDFDLGTLTDSNNDNATAETLVIRYTARVTNASTNTSNGAAAGQTLNNTATLQWEVGGVTESTSPVNAEEIEIIEPELVISKTVNDDTPHLGQVITYTIVIEHTAASDADAHDLTFVDLLPGNLTLDPATLNIAGANVVADTSSGNGINVVLDTLAIGDTITITYDATVTSDATQIGSNQSNTGSTTWSSLPDGDPVGSTERDGDGGNAGEDDYADSSTETLVITHPQAELLKEQVNVVPSASGVDGNFDVTYQFTINSTGNDPLTQVSLIEDLATQYGNAFVGIVTQGGLPAIITASTAADNPELNANFDGAGDTEIFDNTGANVNSIAQGESVTVQIIVEVDPNAAGAVLVNGDLVNQAQVTATGDDTGVVITDQSDDPGNLTDDDPDGDNNPDDPNTIRFPNISLEKTVAGTPVVASSGAAGNFDVTYSLTITNTGSTELDSLILNENLAAHFGGAFVRVVPQPGSGDPAAILASSATDDPGINAAFDGTAANQNIFDGSSSLLQVNESITIEIIVELDPDNSTAIFDGVSGDGSGDFENQATVTATDSGDPGTSVSDNSDDPTDALDNSDDPDNDPDDPTGVILSDITLTKTQFGAVVPATSGVSGNFEVTYDLEITNTGGQALDSLSLIEDLQAQYGGAFVGIVLQGGDPATIVASTAADVPEISGSYDGTTANSQIFDNSGANTNLLGVGEAVTVRVVIEIDPDNASANLVNGALLNQASTEGTGVIDGAMPSDDSDDPNDATDVDPGMDNNPDDPNVLSIAEIELEKAVTGTPVIASSGAFGNFDITYTFDVTNTGTETLSNISLVDDLATQLGGVFVDVISVSVIPGTATSAPAANNVGVGAYDGTAGSDLLAGSATDQLRPGETFSVILVVEIDPDSPTANFTPAGVLENSAMTFADGENGGMASDVSDDPTDAQDVQDPSDPGNDPDDPTPLYVPAIGLAKAAGDAVANGDNFDVTFTLVVENNGTVDLNNLTLFDDVASQFGNAFVSASGLSVQNFVGTGTAPGVNGAWNGNTALDILDGTGQLDVGDSFEVTFTVTIDPDGIDSISQALENQADITGDALDENGNPIDDGMGGTLQATDDSDNGVDPDSENGEDNGDGTPGNDPTPIIIADVAVTKEVFGTPVQLANDNFAVTYQLVVENTGTVDLANLSLIDDISAQFGAAFVGAGSATLISGPSDPGSSVVLDSANWDGDLVTELIDQSAATSLVVGDSYIIQFTVEVDPDATGTSGPLDNQATAGGDAVDENGDPINDSSGDPIAANDDSDSGTEPSDTNTGADGDTGGSDDPTPLLLPALSVGKQANQVITATDGMGNELTGSFDVQYLVVIENTGTVELTNLQLLDDLTTTSTFGDAFDPTVLTGALDRSGLVTGPAIVSHSLANPGDLPNLNAGFLGGGSQTNLFDGTSGVLQVGEQIVVSFTVRIDASELQDGDPTDGLAQNQVEGSADSAQGAVNDQSDDGLDPNSDNGEGGTDDPTPFEVPQVRIYKTHSDAVDNGDGTSEITVTLRIENSGTVDLSNLSLSEDIAAQFGAAFVSATTPTITIGATNPASNIPASLINAAWNGDTSLDLFDAAETGEFLKAGDDFTIEFGVVVDPDLIDEDSDFLVNTATISGEGTNFDGSTVTVDDESGADTGTGIDTDEPTAAIVPEIAIVKSAGDAVANGDNFDVTFTLIVENTGSVNLNNLTLFDDIESQFGNAFVSVSGLAVQGFVGSGTAPTSNPGWEADNVLTLINGGNLDPGDRFEVIYTVTVDPDGIDSVSQALENQATVNGDAVDGSGNPFTDDFGDPLRADDVSDDGSNPQGTNPGENGDQGTDADPTPLIIADVSIAKEVIGQPSVLPNGNFAVTYQLVVENIGTVNLDSLTLVDDIETQFGASVFQGVSGLTFVTPPGDAFSSITLDPTDWDGTAATDILDQSASNTLAIGDQFTISFVVEVDAVQATGVLLNQATVGGTGVDDMGNPFTNQSGDEITASDESDSGSETADNNVGEPNDSGGSDDPTPTYIPSVGLAKQAGDAVPNGDNFDVTFTLFWENTGNVDLTNLTVTDDIAAQFGNAFVSVGGLAITNFSGTGTAPTVNAAWEADTTLSLVSGGTANVGDSFEIVFTVTIDPDGIDNVSQPLENQAMTSGDALNENGDPLEDASGDPISASDNSDNGTDPTGENGEDDGNGVFGDDPTPIIIADVSVVKEQVGTPLALDNGNFEVTYQLVVENTGTVDLADLSLIEDLNANFGSVFVGAGNLTLATGPSASSSISLDGSWDGGAATEIIDPSAATLLSVGDSFVVTFTVEVDPDAVGAPAQLENQVTVAGNAVDSNGSPINDSSGDPITTSDESDDGSDPNGDNPDAQGDNGTSDDPTPLLIPDIGITKTAGDAIQVGDNFRVHFRFFIENTGTVALDNLTLFDDLAAEFGNAFVFTDNLAVVNFNGSGTAPGVNLAWEGDTSQNIFDGTGSLDVGDRFQVTFFVEIDPDGLDSVSQALENQASVGGEGINPDGTPLTDDAGNPITANDVSDDGTDVHGENDSDDMDGVVGNDPTPIIIADVGVAKEVLGQPQLLPNGNFEAVFQLVVENIGTVDLANLSLTDDIATQFGGQFVDAYDLILVTAPANASSTVALDSANFDGDGFTQLIDGSSPSLLAVGDSFVVQFNVEIDPDAGGTATAPLENQVTVSGDAVDSNGDAFEDSDGNPITATDDSDDGTEPSNGNPNANGDQGTSDDPTPVYIPSLGLAKEAGDAVPNGENFDVTFTFVVENTGTVDLTNLELLDDLAAEFGNAFVSASNLSVQNFTGSGVAPAANSAWEGDTSLNLLDGSGQLNVGDAFEVVFTVTIDPDGVDSVSQALENQGVVTGDGLDGNGDPLVDDTGAPIQAMDESDNGTDPNGENEGDINGDGTFANDPTPIQIADIGIAKAVIGEPVLTPLGHYVVTFEVVVENTGTVDLANLSLIEDLTAQFGSALVTANNLSVVSGTTDPGSSIAINSAFNGSADTELIDQTATNIFQTGDSFTLSFDVEIDPDQVMGQLENQVSGTGEAISETGDPLANSSGDPLVATDLSDSGTDPGTSNSDDPSDQGTPDDPVIVDLPPVPLSSISGTVFQDDNNDGVQGPGEEPIAGVEIILTGTDVDGNPVEITTFTDANGEFSFDDLTAGNYTVTQVQPAGFDDGIDTPGSSSVIAGNDLLSNIELGFGEDFGGNTFAELVPNPPNTGASGNPPQIPGLPPLINNLISNRLDQFLGGPGPIYSGIPINGNGNPLSLDSGRPISGGYSGDGESFAEDCGCEEIVTPDPCGPCEAVEVDSVTDVGNSVLVEEVPVECDPCGEEVIVECDACVPCSEPTEIVGEECHPRARAPFLKRFGAWLTGTRCQ